MAARAPPFLSRWVPAGLTAEEQGRGAVLVVYVLIGALFSTVSAVLAGVNGLSVLAALNLAAALWSALALVTFFVTRRMALVAHLFIGGFAVTLALGALSSDPYDLSNVAFLQLVPLVAATLIGRKATIGWLLVTISIGVGAIAAGEHGYVIHQADPAPGFTHAMNFTFCALAGMAFVFSFWWERERAMEGMREAERHRVASLANIGHDIRTPMNGVLGMTDVLLLDPALPARHREMVETIRNSGGVMVSLINDLLDLSKADAGRLVIHPAPLDVRALATELKMLWEPVAARSGLALGVSVDDSVPRALLADGVRLRQVLSNLLSNALKFTTEGGVRVTMGATRARWSIAVTDTGPGLTPGQLERLFERFSHAEDHRTRSQQGTGLGLAVSRQLCQLMQGTLEARSRPGEGSTFTCDLPLTACAVDAPEQASAGAVKAGLKVLVVDDNAVNRLVARRLLEAAECRVTEATDGAGAVTAATGEAFDLILMDLHMPVLDGLEATRQLRARDYGGVIIGVSASAASDDEAQCRSAGMNDFLAKPVRAERLFLKLEEHRSAAL